MTAIRPVRAFINPGHDVHLDSGAVSADGRRECDFALAIGQVTQRALINAGADAAIMQSDDLPNVVRTANTWPSDCFVSIHCNAAENILASGTETLLYSIRNHPKTKLLADCVNNSIVSTMRDVDASWIDRGLKERPSLYVLRATYMAAVLAEVGFMSNSHDCDLVNENFYEIGRAIARAITDWWLLVNR